MLSAVDFREEKRAVKLVGYGKPKKPTGFRAWLRRTGRRALVLAEDIWGGEKSQLIVQVGKR